MVAARRVKDILADRASKNFIGRHEEMSKLLSCLSDDGPLVTWLHGMAGIGKTTLLTEFRGRAAASGAQIVCLDARSIEPTPDGFRRALGDGLATSRSARQTRQLLVIDSYESFLLLDSWLRQSFIPELDETVRVVLASRYPPNASWILAIGWEGLFREVHLRELTDSQAVELLMQAGISQPDAEQFNRFARGIPLALQLTKSCTLRLSGDEFAARAVFRQLADFYLDGLGDAELRAAMEAASVVQCLTRSLLKAILPRVSADVYDRLAESSFVDLSQEGLILHDAVREAIASNFADSDPHRFRLYRQSAWRRLRAEATTANRGQMWLYTSGMIYLLQNPVVREAFFPASAQPVHVEPASAADGGTLLDIMNLHETPAAASILNRWWSCAPGVFRVVRNAQGNASGFYICLNHRDKNLPQMPGDPLALAWRHHLRTNPIAPNETAVYLRRWLCAANGELPSAVQAACWLDVKRVYLELRPQLRRCYLTVCDLATYGPTAKSLGFELVERAAANLDGMTHHLAVLDFGPGSVDAWLAQLAAGELGVGPSHLLDLDSRELLLDDGRIALTPLEFELLRYLQKHAGKPVTRAELMEHVWRRRPDSSSNVVDVLVRCVRRKMGARAAELIAVRGCGYSLRTRGEAARSQIS